VMRTTAFGLRTTHALPGCFMWPGGFSGRQGERGGGMEELRTVAVVLAGLVVLIGAVWTVGVLERYEPEQPPIVLEWVVPVALFWAGVGLVVAAVTA